ncbi:hypothetical protein CSUI_002822 [Cystoisospora suis]|uniref:Uncharacterized protein n=1 Tax=Cystoisospora suis TaxID=483139 RepID=A0A2C6L7B4_9APIC|nr:hypothetical protein CSUI_002822 [Cystoisospora suis]
MNCKVTALTLASYNGHYRVSPYSTEVFKPPVAPDFRPPGCRQRWPLSCWSRRERPLQFCANVGRSRIFPFGERHKICNINLHFRCLKGGNA